MEKMWIILGCMVVILLAAGGCTSQNPYGSPTPTVPATQQTTIPGGTTVTIQNFAFAPGILPIAKGTTVTWVNQDAVEHQVTNDAFGTTAQGAYFESSPLAKEATYSFTFTTAGTYRYHCKIHPSMTATISVT